MIHFDSESWAMVSPNGKSFDITTPDGANEFLLSVSNFDFFSSKVSELKDVPPEDNDRSFEMATTMLATNATNKKLFREKVSVEEIEKWMKYATEEIEKLATKPSCFPAEKLHEHDKWVLDQCSAMFSHPVALGSFEIWKCFRALAKFLKARMEANLPSLSAVCECFLSILWQVFNTCQTTEELSSAFAFSNFRIGEIFEPFLRCILIPELDGLLLERIDIMLEHLELDFTSIKEGFKKGSPSGKVLRAVLQDKSGIRKTRENIFQKLEYLVDAVDESQPRCKNCDKSQTSIAKMKTCSGCRVARYCSRECQKADWKTHKQECRAAAARSDPQPVNGIAGIFPKATETLINMFVTLNSGRMMVRMAEECAKNGSEPQDVILQIDFEPQNGSIPALRDPPEFSAATVQDYIEGSQPKEPKWYIDINRLKEERETKGPEDVLCLVRTLEGVTELRKIATDGRMESVISGIQTTMTMMRMRNPSREVNFKFLRTPSGEEHIEFL